MIKTHIDQAIRNLEAEKEQTIRQVEQRVMQEKIVPFNRDIDLARDKAVQQLSAEYAQKKEEIFAMSEKHKKENAERVVAEEAATLIAKYDEAIAALKAVGNTQE